MRNYFRRSGTHVIPDWRKVEGPSPASLPTCSAAIFSKNHVAPALKPVVDGGVVISRPVRLRAKAEPLDMLLFHPLILSKQKNDLNVIAARKLIRFRLEPR
jgi:hypothetical protein